MVEHFSMNIMNSIRRSLNKLVILNGAKVVMLVDFFWQIIQSVLFWLLFFIITVIIIITSNPRGWIIWPIPGSGRQLCVSKTHSDRYDSSKITLFIACGRNYTLRVSVHVKGVCSRADNYVFLVYKFRTDRH